MKSRLYRLLDVTRKENLELTERVMQLEKELICEREINDDLMNAYGRVHDLYMKEKKVNDTLVKHSHILFEKLSKMQELRQHFPKPKVEARKPTSEELEDLFKETIADGTKD